MEEVVPVGARPVEVWLAANDSAGSLKQTAPPWNSPRLLVDSND